MNDKNIAPTAPESASTNVVDPKKEKHKKSRFLEIIRFVIVGVLCTLIDAIIFYLLMRFAFPKLAEQGGNDGWGGYVAWALATTISFFLSCIVNYLLSRVWVYQNVDRKINTKTPKAFWTYVGLAAIGWLLGVAIQELGVWICNSAWPDMQLSTNFVKVSWTDLWNGQGTSFWAFVIIFVIKTICTMIYNYTTRKKIIFKAPKKEDASYKIPNGEMVVTIDAGNKGKAKADQNAPAPEKNENHITTAESFQAIWKEELHKQLPESKKAVDVIDARQIVREELNQYEAEHGRSLKADSKSK